MRTYFAIKIPETILDRILQDTSSLREGMAGVTWTPANQIHLTMKFMGEFDPVHIDPLHSRLADACVDLKPFTLTTSGIGVFPARGNPRVIWFGIENQPKIACLAGIIENTCAHDGYAREKRPFSPHLTIGRVKRTARAEDFRSIRQSVSEFRPIDEKAFTVSVLHFIRSTLTPGGPIYHDLFHVPLT